MDKQPTLQLIWLWIGLGVGGERGLGHKEGALRKICPPTAQAHAFTCSHRPPPRYERVLVWAQLIKHVDPDSPQGAPFSGPGGKGNAVNLKIFLGGIWWYWFYSRLARESRAWLGLLSGTWVTQRQLNHHKAHSAWSSLEHRAQLQAVPLKTLSVGSCYCFYSLRERPCESFNCLVCFVTHTPPSLLPQGK